MTITRSNVEQELANRCGALMTAVGIDYAAGSPTQPLNSPIAYALRQGGYTIANHANVSNGDLAEVTDEDIDMIFDYAELRLLENILGNYTKVDASGGGFSQSLGQIRGDLETRIARLQASTASLYGTAGDLESGWVMLGFADHNDTDIENE